MDKMLPKQEYYFYNAGLLFPDHYYDALNKAVKAHLK